MNSTSSNMLVGITYDLMADYLALGLSREAAAEFDKPETIDAIENGLRNCGYDTVRIGNVLELNKRLALGESWDIVFNICEGLYGIGREAQVPALLDAFDIPYVFSDPLVLSLTLHKGMTKFIVKGLGIPTPDFIILNSESDLSDVDLSFPLFVKPAAEGSGKGINVASTVKDIKSLEVKCNELFREFGGPVLVERFLPGREFTVAIIGTANKARCIGIMECTVRKNAPGDSYSFENKNNYTEFMEYSFPKDEKAILSMEIALRAWRGLGCRDAGRIDMRLDENGVPNFIEVNPLAGLHPVDSDYPIIARKSGMDYDEIIRLIMESAKERIIRRG